MSRKKKFYQKKKFKETLNKVKEYSVKAGKVAYKGLSNASKNITAEEGKEKTKKMFGNVNFNNAEQELKRGYGFSNADKELYGKVPFSNFGGTTKKKKSNKTFKTLF